MNKYEGTLPVDQEWNDAHIGEEWTFILIMDLTDLIEICGIDEMNETCDDITGTILSNLSYRVAPHWLRAQDNNTVVIEATGTVEEN